MLPRSPRAALRRWLHLLFLLPGAAWAQSSPLAPPPPQWSGVELSLVEWLSPPRADGFTSGLTADFKGGLVRVYVMPSETAASWWVHRMTTVVDKQKPTSVPLPEPESTRSPSGAPPSASHPHGEPPPRLPTAQELYTTGDSLVIARVDNVGIMVETRAHALDRAEAVLAVLSDLPAAWPVVPPLERTASGWTIHPEADTLVRFQGGSLGTGPGLHFTHPPSTVVVYDALGRASRQSYDTMGFPISTPEPWAEHTLTERGSTAPESP